MHTLDEYLNASPADRAQMLTDERAAPGYRHRGLYDGASGEAWRAIRRLANRAAPTHRGAPRNA